MGSEPLVVDLSSDDDDVDLLDEKNCPFDDFKDDPIDWSELFGGTKDGGDSDDVVVVEELSGPPAAKEKDKLDGLAQKYGDCKEDESDDDCLVLDDDPEKSVRVVNDQVNRGDEEEDDLVVVQEKGQVACRDYPHPRHLCANFPFNSSAHVQHCKLCHCYVCDCPAPCEYWGNGESGTDHCHSNDKDNMWKSQRQLFRQKRANQVPITTPSTTNAFKSCSAVSIRSHSSNNQRHHQMNSILSHGNQGYGLGPPRPAPLSTGTHIVQREARLSSLLDPQNMLNRTRFKRVPMTLSHRRLNSNGLHRIRNNHISRPLTSLSYNGTSRSQRHQHPQPGLRASDHFSSIPTGVVMNQQANIAVNQGLRPLPATLPTYQWQLETSLNDSTQDWQAMLASMAYDLGVSSNITEDTCVKDNIEVYPDYPSAAPPIMDDTDLYSNLSPQYANVDDLNAPGNCGSQMNNSTVNHIAEHGNNNYNCQMNNATVEGTAEHGDRDEETGSSTLQLLNSIPSGIDSDSSNFYMESLFASEEISEELPILGDSDSQFFDIGVLWSSFLAPK